MLADNQGPVEFFVILSGTAEVRRQDPGLPFHAQDVPVRAWAGAPLLV